MPGSREIKKQIRESLGLPAKHEQSPTVPIEGHICDFPIWSYSRKRASIKTLHIDYPDGSFFTLEALKGMPGPSFAGYLDSILYYGQHDLFKQEYVEISIYCIFSTLGLDTNNGGNYEIFRRDMRKVFAMYMETDRFRDPETGERSHICYFRVLDTMKIAKNRHNSSVFYFNDIFLSSLRAGYLKRLDFEYCLNLDRNNKPLSRFLYGHILKRLGEKSIYTRKLSGFLNDIGLGYIGALEPKARNQRTKQVLIPALDGLQGEAFTRYEIDDRENIFFIS